MIGDVLIGLVLAVGAGLLTEVGLEAWAPSSRAIGSLGAGGAGLAIAALGGFAAAMMSGFGRELLKGSLVGALLAAYHHWRGYAAGADLLPIQMAFATTALPGGFLGGFLARALSAPESAGRWRRVKERCGRLVLLVRLAGVGAMLLGGVQAAESTGWAGLGFLGFLVAAFGGSLKTPLHLVATFMEDKALARRSRS